MPVRQIPEHLQIVIGFFHDVDDLLIGEFLPARQIPEHLQIVVSLFKDISNLLIGEFLPVRQTKQSAHRRVFACETDSQAPADRYWFLS